MEKQHRIAQIYGYAVCLVTVIIFLINVASLVNAIIDRAEPLYAGRLMPSSPSLASFENYKIDVIKSSQEAPSYVPDDSTLRKMYEAAKADKIQSVQHRTRRSIIVSSLLIALCVGFFGTHWMWMTKLSKSKA